MYTTDHERIAAVAPKMHQFFLETSIPSYLVLSAFAGVYVGFGIALIFSYSYSGECRNGARDSLCGSLSTIDVEWA